MNEYNNDRGSIFHYFTDVTQYGIYSVTEIQFP
jgi:hypothetical protein